MFTDKRRVLLVALIVCLVAILAAGSIAYFTAEETALNVITTGRLEMKLHELDADGKPFPTEGISGVLPGDKITKTVYVENTGRVDSYIRIAVEKSITPDTLSTKYVSMDVNTDKWTEKDGWYYYNETLKPGQKTEPLFTTVTFAPEMDNPYMDSTVQIKIDAQAVQSRNNGADALTATGWAANTDK